MDSSIHTIIVQGLSEGADEAQKQKLLALFHQPEIEFELKSQLLEELDQSELSTSNRILLDGVFEKFWDKRKLNMPKPRKIHYFLHLTKWVAILVVGLFLGYLLNSVQKSSYPGYYTAFAPKGSVSEMVLPDGSHVFLNSDSKIKYSVEGKDGMREVFLTGEAWFQVASMKERPFLVHTPLYDVKVTGTVFNIKAYPEDKELITTLEEGSIRIKSSENLEISEEIVLRPGDQLVYNKDSQRMQLGTVNPKLYSSWKDNKLVFINMSLKDLKTLLERKYGVEIKIFDQNILNYHYDGIIRNETILEVLDILKLTLPIDYKIANQVIVIQQVKEGGHMKKSR